MVGLFFYLILPKHKQVNDKPLQLIDLNDDLDLIHQAKLKHHEEQMKFHTAQYKALLQIVKGKSNGHSTGFSEVGLTSDHFRQSYWEERIPAIMTEHIGNKEFVNSDISNAEGLGNIQDDETKRKIRYGISMALGALVDMAFLTSRKKKGIKGFLYKRA